MRRNSEKVLIIGGGIAGRNVCRELIGLGKASGITLVKRESHGSYSPCGLPYVIGGEVDRMEDILFPAFDRKLTENNVRVITGTEVRRIDLPGKRAETGKGELLTYDRLVIATGRRPRIPQLPGVRKDGVCTLSNYEDGVRIYRELHRIKKAVVIGGGFIGCELVTAFCKRGIETVLVEIKPHILPQILDESMALLVQDRLRELGCRIIAGKGVTRINGNARVESVSVEDVESPIETDLVVMAVGVMPETTLAAQTGLEIGKSGGLVTDSSQHPRMNGEFLKDAYALGDCVEVKDRLTGNGTLSPLTETAIVQARIIALDISGREEKPGGDHGKGYVRSFLTAIGDWQVGMTGLTSAEAKEFGFCPRAVQAAGWSKEVYYPGKTRIHIRLILEGDRLIGAQLIGEEDVRGMLNELNVLIHTGKRIEDILYRQRDYSPALSSSPDVLVRALEKLPARISRKEAAGDTQEDKIE